MDADFKKAVKATMDRLQAQGESNVDRMREFLNDHLNDAIVEWQTDHVEATTDEEQE